MSLLASIKDSAIEAGHNIAIVVVDDGNDFSHPSGSLYVPGGEFIVPGIADFLIRADRINRSVARLNREHPHISGLFHLVKVNCDHPKETAHFAEWGGKWPPHCVRGTWGAASPPDLIPASHPDGIGDLLISEHLSTHYIKKGQDPASDGYSAFYNIEADGSKKSTGLTQLLENLNISVVILCGWVLDVCVRASALDALQDGFKVDVLVPLTVSLSPNGQRDAILEIEESGGNCVGCRL